MSYRMFFFLGFFSYFWSVLQNREWRRTRSQGLPVRRQSYPVSRCDGWSGQVGAKRERAIMGGNRQVEGKILPRGKKKKKNDSEDTVLPGTQLLPQPSRKPVYP